MAEIQKKKRIPLKSCNKVCGNVKGHKIPQQVKNSREGTSQATRNIRNLTGTGKRLWSAN